MSVKSVPGCLVAIPPSLIGVPVARLPLPSPHFDAAADCVAPPLAAVLDDELALLEPELESSPSHAATTRDRTAATPATATALRMLLDPRSILTAPPPVVFDVPHSCDAGAQLGA